MTGLFEALTMVLLAACFVTRLGSVYDLPWFAFAGRDAGAKVRSVDGWARREASWGLLLASPLLFAVLAAAASPGTWWWVSLLSAVAICECMVAVGFARAVGRRDRNDFDGLVDLEATAELESIPKDASPDGQNPVAL